MKLKTPPLLVTILTALAMWIFARFLPELSVFMPWSNVTTIVLGVIGTLVLFLSFITFQRADTTVDPRYPGHSSSLVTTGIYQYTRNPMYLGMVIWLMAWAFYLQNAFSFILIFGFVGYMNKYQIEPEEEALKKKFSNKYSNYRSKVRRWI